MPMASPVWRAGARLLHLAAPGVLVVLVACQGLALAGSPPPPERQEALEAHVLATPPGVTGAVATLARYLGGPAQDEVERAWVIFRWMGENISYDVQGFLSGRPGPTTPEEVLQSRTSVCEGYARLFTALAQALGLEAETIRGNAKGFGYVAGEDLGPKTAHAWNAVNIGEEWRLLDATWGAGSIDPQGNFVKRAEPAHFLVPPGEFAYRHFPDDEKWQLMDPPLTLEQFMSLPFVSAPFFKLGLGFYSHTQATIAAERSLMVQLVAPPGVSLTAKLVKDGADLSRRLIFTQPGGEQYQILVLFPAAGEYVLRIFGGTEGAEFEQAVEYQVKASGGVSAGIEFPVVYGTFHETGAVLGEPLPGHLAEGTTRFDLMVPGAEQVAVVNGEEWVMLARSGEDRFTGEVALRAGKAGVYAQFPGKESFSGLLAYDVP